jgi:phosphate uptake regulator
MRTAFHQQLDTLTTAIAEMCALASRAMQDATQALLHDDAALAERVIAKHDEIIFNAGTFVIANTAAANRDPAVYKDPERLDITREGPPPKLTTTPSTRWCATR